MSSSVKAQDSQTLYRKVGRRYEPAAERWYDDHHRFGHGCWLMTVSQGSVRWRWLCSELDAMAAAGDFAAEAGREALSELVSNAMLACMDAARREGRAGVSVHDEARAVADALAAIQERRLEGV